MIIKPENKKIESLYSVFTEEAIKLSRMCIPFFALIGAALPFFIFFASQFMENSRSFDFDDLCDVLPIAAITGAVVGFLIKGFVKNLIIKENATFITEIKKSGLKVEDDFITGKMLKVVQTTNVKTNIEPIPRKAFDVSFKLSQISNVEILDKNMNKANYSKFCIITVGVEKYYLVCLSDADAVSLRDYILSSK